MTYLIICVDLLFLTVLFQQLPDQFSPYKGVFGCNDVCFNKGFFPGTFFRFPLRTEPSELSETIYDSGKVENLFSSFERDAHLVLIFLKSVEVVELYKRSKDQTEPKLQFRVGVSPDCIAQVRQKRKKFLGLIDPNRWMERPLSCSYPLTIDAVSFAEGGTPNKKSFRYLVTEYYAGGEASLDLKALYKDPGLSYVPLVGLAMPIQDPTQKGTNDEDVENANDKIDEKDLDDVPSGHVFCFLPLPIEQKSSTGLPVHVNGYFSISQNRRHLKWPSAGQSIKSDKALLWNYCLLNELLPKCYVELILSAIDHCERLPKIFSPEHVLSAIPNLLSVSEKWKGALEPFFTALFQHKVFYTRASTDRSPSYGQSHPQAGSGRWVSLNECIFDCMREKKATKQTVKQVLLNAGVKVVEIPMYILHALGAYGCYSPETITPSLVRSVIRSRPDTYGHLGTDERLVLLAYVLKDEDFPDLEGLQMLPLANNQFDVFTHRTVATRIYIPSRDHPRNVLPGMERNLVMDGLDDIVMKKLDKLANEGKMLSQT